MVYSGAVVRGRSIIAAICGSGWSVWILATGPALAAPQEGQQFKNWMVGCEQIQVLVEEQQQEREACYIFQNIALKDSGQRLLHMAVGYLAADGKPAAIITLPLGMYLPPGVALNIDEGEPVRLAVQQCTQAGCRAVLALDEALVARMKAGNQARVNFLGPNRKEISVPVSLLGFTAGMNALGQ